MKNLLLIILLFTAIGFGWHFYGEIIKENEFVVHVLTEPLIIARDTIQVDDQESQGVVNIKLLSISKHGFVVLQDDEQGPGKVLGVSELLAPVQSKIFKVNFFEKPEEGYVFASLYQDDGDGVFDIYTDIPIRGLELAHVQTRFLITAPENSEEAPSAAQE